MNTHGTKTRMGFILIGFTAIILLSLSAYLINHTTVTDNAFRLNKNISLNAKIQNNLVKMNEIIQKRMLITYDLLLTNDPFIIDEKAESFKEVAIDFIKAREALEQLEISPSFRQELSELKLLLHEARYILYQLIEMRLDGKKPKNFSEINLARNMNILATQRIRKLISDQTSEAEASLISTRKYNSDAEKKVLILNLLSLFISIGVVSYVLIQLKRQGERLDDAMLELEDSNSMLEVHVAKRSQELFRVREENLRISAEVKVSQQLQEMLLPTQKELGDISQLDIATHMTPAEEVGGDYFDILPHKNGLLITVGDVTGHGLESGIIMLMTQSLIRHQLLHGVQNLSQALVAVNHTLYQNLQRIKSERNLTLSLLDYHPLTNNTNGAASRFNITGQHEDIIVVRNNGQLETIDTLELGMPLGLLDNIEEYVGEKSLTLYQNDLVVLFTDGITEAINSDNAFYGMDRLCDICRANHQRSSDGIRDTIIADLNIFVGEQKWHDDVSLVVIKQL